jgi:drug/metabolite transporter (DMT)-like permease
VKGAIGNPARGVIWAAATALSYSLSAIVGKDLLDNLGTDSLLFWRFGLASIVLWVGLAIRRPSEGVRTAGVSPLMSLVLGATFGVLVYVGFLSLERLDASVYIVIVYVYPVLVVVATSLLGHRTAPLTWAALALVMAGIVLTVPELFSGNSEIDVVGVLLAIGQAALFAGFIVINSRVIPEHANGVVTAAWTVLGAALVLAPMVVWRGLVVPDTGWLIVEVALFALVPTVISNICFFRALRFVAPGIVAMVLTLEVALAILWSVLFLGESLRAVQYAGAAVVVVAVLLAQWVGLRDARQRSALGLDTVGAASAP